MRGQQHDEQQRLLMHAFNNRSIEAMHETIRAGLERFVRGWSYDDRISLLDEMRRLTLELSSSLLFDQRYDESSNLAVLAQKYFHTRRNTISASNSPDETMRTELIALGASLDQAMREYIRWCRNGGGGAEGLLAKLACLQAGSEYSFSEDEAVAHGNVTFMSTNEPIAVALTWTLLILSQMPELRRALRERINSPLLNSVVNESLRLFTPNALMSRITTRDTSLDGIPLPARCELVLCPFLAHRDANVFPKPAEFLPARWQSTKPSPFDYFPFGAGGHTCIGRSLGLKTIAATIAFLMQRYELVLAGDQEIDWTIDIIFSPANDPIVTVQEPGTSDRKPGRLLGPVSELFQI
jgi:cytochrome P450